MDSRNKNKRTFGSFGEKIALEYLEKENFKIISQNYRVGRLGEIDIIASEKEFLCFLEVKTRTSYLFGAPSEAVNRKKQECIKRLAQIYIKQHNIRDKNLRFDIVEVIVDKKCNVKEINLLKNAF